MFLYLHLYILDYLLRVEYFQDVLLTLHLGLILHLAPILDHSQRLFGGQNQ